MTPQLLGQQLDGNGNPVLNGAGLLPSDQAREAAGVGIIAPWSSANAYALLDCAAHGGVLYQCILAVGPTATTPDADGSHWVALTAAVPVEPLLAANNLGDVANVAAARANLGALPSPVAAVLASIPFVRWFRAAAITPVADGTALASWVDSAGSGDPAVQATGGEQPVYKVAGNGINGVPVVRFSGGQFLRTLHGGAALGGAITPWYMACLVRLTTLSNYGIIEFGDDAGSHRRAIMYLNDARGMSFNGNGSDVYPPGQPTIAINTPYFVEIGYDGVSLWCALNGALHIIGLPSSALQASASDPITLGANNTGGENLNGDLAEVFILGRMPTRSETSAIRLYIASTYGVIMPSTSPWLQVVDSQSQINGASESAGALAYEGLTRFGSDDQLVTGLSSAIAPNLPANHSFRGSVAMDASGTNAEHSLASNNDGANVAHVWNKNIAGYSVLRYLNSLGDERAAMGVANESSAGPFKLTALGNLFIEASGDGSFAFVQTNSAGGSGQLLRFEYQNGGDMVFYDFSGAEIFRIGQGGGITFKPRAAPSSPVEGMLYYDSTAHKLKIRTAAGWETVTSS